MGVEMAGFLPRLPSIDLQAPVARVLSIDGGTPHCLEWMADVDRLALINGVCCAGPHTEMAAS